MNESPDEWLERLEFEYCPECGGDADDHEVRGLGNTLRASGLPSPTPPRRV